MVARVTGVTKPIVNAARDAARSFAARVAPVPEARVQVVSDDRAVAIVLNASERSRYSAEDMVRSSSRDDDTVSRQADGKCKTRGTATE